MTGLWPTAYQAIMAGQSPFIPGPPPGESPAGGEPDPPPAGQSTELDALAKVRAFHAAWGEADVEELDPLDLWEQLGRILGVTA